MTGPWGGIALTPYDFLETDGEGSRRWHIDPFAFFRAALGLSGVPAPHPAVLNGRRVFFCHVDGDGFESISTLRRGAICGEVFLEEIVEKYRLPFSVSVIVATLTDDLDPKEPTARMRIASRLLGHSRVEAASHSVLHPFRWARPDDGEESSAAFPGLAGYVPSPRGEVRESVRFIDKHLLSGGKRCALMLWTGNCYPPREAIEEAERLGLLNMNGGEFRLDPLYDSVGYVSPFARLLGGAVQVYCGAPNEVIYDGYMSNNPLAFRHVSKTIERTGTGRIIKPANVYVHLFSAARPGRMKVLKGLLERWALKEPTAPVFASTYAGAVRSALTTARILRTPDGWAFQDFGDCRTARIDDETRHVDWERSTGLIGARRWGRSLYLHLSAPDGEVALRSEPAPAPHVKEANHLLEDASRSKEGVAVTSESLAPRVIVFAGFPPGSRVLLRLDDVESEARADQSGEVRLELEDPGRTRVEARRP